MKFAAVALAVFAALVSVDATAESSSIRIRVHAHEEKGNDAICYKACPSGQYCARGTTECRAPKGNSECFNPATSRWIPKCDPGFKCKNGKCDYAKKHKEHGKKHEEKGNDAICYKACPSGQYCARGTTECRAPKGNSECFNPATSRWISKCDPGFTCKNGKCDYAKKHKEHGKKHEEKGNDAICYKACPSGQYCARGTTECRAPKGNSECFNPATSRWISKCDPGFTCKNGKCDYAKKHKEHGKKQEEKGNDAICYKACPSGQYCARGTTECRAPKGNSECFNPATSRWISKCDPGFACKNGKCDYAKKIKVHVETHVHHKGNDAICYKACPSGQYCARGTTECRAPKGNSECFNPATSRWIPKCDPGFKCKNGKCDYA